MAGIDGITTGNSNAAMIADLMKLEAAPQNRLKARVADNKLFASALQALNTKIASLAEAAGKLSKPAGTDLYAAVSSSDKVTAVTKPGASAGALDIRVDKLAAAQVSLSGAMAAWPTGDALSISRDGTITEFDTAGKSLDEVISTVNKANLGVTAVKVAAGSVDGVAQYRMQFTATAAGSAGAFTVSHNGADLGSIRPAQDAQVTLWAGVAGAETSITSSSNTFTDLLPGVDVTVAAVSETPVTISVSRDDKAISDVAAKFVAGLVDVFSYINKNAAVSVSTTDGSTKATGGLFTSDSGIRDIKQQMMNAATAPVDGRSPSEIGIVITKDGTVEFNAEKFAAALKADPEKTEATLQTIASRVEAAGKSASDKYEGAITQRIQGKESEVRSLNTQIEDWDRRLASRQATLERTWNTLEVTLGTLNNQMDWLTSQLSALTASSSKK